MERDERMPDELIYELFGYALGASPQTEARRVPPPPPTTADIERIERDLDIRLPSLLIRLAIHSPFFTRWFAELGSQPETPGRHIIALNDWLVEAGKPEDLIALTHSFDGDCVGLSRGSNDDPDTAPIMYLSVDLTGGGRTPGSPRIHSKNFREYLEKFCLCEAPRSHVKSLRRKAKRRIAEWQRSLDERRCEPRSQGLSCMEQK